MHWFCSFLCHSTSQHRVQKFDCALVSTLEVYDNPDNDNYCKYCKYCHYNVLFYFTEIIVIIDVFVIMLIIKLIDSI